MPNGNLSWICKYPKDADGTVNVNSSLARRLALPSPPIPPSAG